ncbi:Alanine--tRNA ligase [Candidatus Bilamarchaeum dharawalense]|uniref:Alanine--tRNA ligase n=1 Tax=Candidatus Bilamarchaeum dharawalense TaxID=2885759 RepID=A0A5E4LQ07_9ARCH|nr:Alanine--tRNA ligase [Candidatus Bilamarchaeum dharawalense]
MDVDKNQLRKEFAAEWEKHYKLDVLIQRGFKRQKCKKCARMFWTKDIRDQCGDPSCIGYQFIGSTPVKKKLGYVDTWKVIEKYFKDSGHGYVKPYPTVARWRDDLYFTIASINDFQPYVVNGELDPPHNPLIVPQPCIRFSDISNVGVSGRHYTNFVMIGQHAFNTKKTGNFYWKEEALTHDLNYLKALGIPEEEIVFQEDVWAGGGNFGPCIEYFVRGLELGNCVFMQYAVTPKGPKELNTKVIDMGAGLSRLAWITSGEPTSYEVVFGPVIENMKKKAGVKIDREFFVRFAKISGSLNEDEVPDLEKEKERIAAVLGVSKKELFETLEPLQALYASADHLCTLLFTVTDGMLPSNSGGGYNLRMLLRRTFGFQSRFGYDLDYAKIIQGHADFLEYIFPHLQSGVDTTIDVIAEEQKRYQATKEKAKTIVTNLVKKSKGGKIPPNELITLYKSQGIPPEAVQEVAKENDVDVEVPGNFYAQVRAGEGEEKIMENQQVKILASDVMNLPKTESLYYDKQGEFDAGIIGIVKGKYVVLDRTAFYPEGGGQVADGGTLNQAKVKFVTRQAGVILHEVEDPSQFAVGDEVKGMVDVGRRKTITRHHTAAHMVNAACREILGSHIWQGGSYKDEEKGHLDVTHYKKITNEELGRIEQKVNEYIMQNMPITTEILPRTQAEAKYGFTLYQGGAVPGKEIRVVSIGNIDHEACGGTHTMLNTTGEIGCFKIVRRESVQDGIERITYKCGSVAIAYMQEKEQLLQQAANTVSVSESELVKTIERFFEEWKEQRKKIESLEEVLVKDEAKCVIEDHAGKPIMKVLDLDESSLRKLALKIAESDKAAACVINKHGNLVCAAGKHSGASAKLLLEKVLKELGGSGGGSDRIAQGRTKKVEMVKL